MKPEYAAAFLPSGHARLMEYGGMTAEQAFDKLAALAAEPDFQAMIQELHATAAGRALLRHTLACWEELGLPCPWDRTLELGPVY